MTLAIIVACQKGFYLMADTRTIDTNQGCYTENSKKVFYSRKHQLGVCIADGAMLSDPEYPNDLEKTISVSYIMDEFFKEIDESEETQTKNKFTSIPAIFTEIKQFIQFKFGEGYLQQFEQDVSLFFGYVINNQTVIGSYDDQKSITLVSSDHKVDKNFVLENIIVLQPKDKQIIAYYTLGDGKVLQGELSQFECAGLLPFPTFENPPTVLKRLENELVNSIIVGCLGSKKLLQSFSYSTDFQTKLCAFSNYQSVIEHYSTFLVQQPECLISGKTEIEKKNVLLSASQFRANVFNNIILETRNFVLTERPDSIGDYFEYVKIGDNDNSIKYAVKPDNPTQLSAIQPDDFPSYVISQTMKDAYDLIEKGALKVYEMAVGTESSIIATL